MAKFKRTKSKRFSANKESQQQNKKGHQPQNKKLENQHPASQQSCQSSSVYKRKTMYPGAYTLSFPKNRFVIPSDKHFDQILSTCYSGLVRTPPTAFSAHFHEKFHNACKALDVKGMYQFDLTQPTGLGTKVVRTFVSRCLVGCPGITYKYLGLRMFAFPWTSGEVGATEEMVAIGELNNAMIRHTQKLLSEKGGEVGSCQYNLTLINRCYPEKLQNGEGVPLKDEPMFKQNKCAVSWHADSTLEHFSTIGVYHFTSPTPFAAETSFCNSNEEETEDSMWRIALRVYHDAEGPTAGKTTDSSHPEAQTNPSILLPLPSRHSYFLLDDFNHHHQHAVVAGTSHRISSTHRVCRTDGHTFDSIRRRCLSALQSPNKLAAKVIRSQQIALNDVEFEWIRQFYIQGSKHQSLHVWWTQPMAVLVDLWGQLERSTEFVLQVLQEAAVPTSVNEEEELPKRYRKKMAKIRKFSAEVDAAAFDAIIEYLNLRKEKRHGWAQRERDPIFRSVSQEYRPLVLPLHFTEDASLSTTSVFLPSKDAIEEDGQNQISKSHDTQAHVLSSLPKRLDSVIKHVEQLKLIFVGKKV